MGSAFSRALAAVETALTLLSAVILFFLMFYVTAEVFMRYVFNRPLPGHLEASQLLIAPAVFLSLSWVQARRGHVGMDLLTERMPRRMRALADLLTLTLALAAAAVLTWFSWISAVEAWQFGDVTPTAYLQTWWSKIAVPIGAGLLCVRFVLQIIEQARILAGRED